MYRSPSCGKRQLDVFGVKAFGGDDHFSNAPFLPLAPYPSTTLVDSRIWGSRVGTIAGHMDDMDLRQHHGAHAAERAKIRGRNVLTSSKAEAEE